MSNLSYNGQIIEQRDLDNYVNATQMCQANGKKVNDWMRGQDSKRYIDAISSVTGIPASQLVLSLRGNSSSFDQGTWIHPKLAIKLARWISVEFELWCDEHIRTLLETGNSGSHKNIIWFNRYQLFKERSKIPSGFFSIFGELSHTLISDFETAGHVMLENSGIDISVGKRWSDHVKAHYPNIDSLRTLYKHHYPDNRGVRDAFIYKDCLLPGFREWLEFTYKISHLYTYLKKNDKQGLITLSEMLQIQLTPNLFDLKLLK